MFKLYLKLYLIKILKNASASSNHHRQLIKCEASVYTFYYETSGTNKHLIPFMFIFLHSNSWKGKISEEDLQKVEGKIFASLK